MKHLGTTVVLGALLAFTGCAAGLVGSADEAGEVRLLTDTLAPAPRVVLHAELAPERAEPAADQRDVTRCEHNTTSRSHEPTPAVQLTADDEQAAEPQPKVADEPSYGLEPPAVAEHLASDVAPPSDESTFHETEPLESEPKHIEAFASDEPELNVPQIPQRAASPTPADAGEVEFAQMPTVTLQEAPPSPDNAESIVTPEPTPRSPFRPDGDETEQDRFSRQVVDVPVDIRPTKGEMPEDLAAVKFADEPTIDETFPSDIPADIFCSHTPWTFCYRPLYFEDIKLERYGCNIGYAQTGLSGVRFFGSILALPYKMTVRPPRSCQCSNGFSRCGDCPLPGYGRREFRLDASLIEAAAVAGVVYILP